jgi:cell division control protein 7
MATIRPRNAKVPFEIHHDEMDGDESLEEAEHPIDESRGDLEEEEDQEADRYSDVSEESDVVVDASVQDDMDKFQDAFKGIKERFRLINRIGEGKSRPSRSGIFN